MAESHLTAPRWFLRIERQAGRLDWLPLLSLVGGAVLWELIGQLLHFRFFPPFSRVFTASIEMIASGEILANLAASLTSLAIGYGLAAVCGILLGALIGRFPQVESFVDIYIQAFMAAPTLIYVPLLFALFGVSRASQVAVVFLYAFFVVTTNTAAGVRKVNPVWVEMAQSFGASERQMLWLVILPGSLPLVLAGLRTGLGRAAKGMINGEMYIALTGLGALIRRYGGRFDADHVIGILLIVTLATLAITSAFGYAERRLLKWGDHWSYSGVSDDLA